MDTIPQSHPHSGCNLATVTLRVPKVMVFDCDGVLFDSRRANIEFYNHILRRFGREALHRDQYAYIHMHSAKESLAYLLGPGPVLEKAWNYCQTLDFRRFNTYLRVEPGLRGLLQFLHGRCPIALATNRTISTMDVLRSFRLDRYFDLVVTAADVAHPKPHPEAMEKILQTFHVPPWDVWFVGDSLVDAQLASATGVVFCAYKNPTLPGQIHVDHFHQLRRKLEERGLDSP